MESRLQIQRWQVQRSRLIEESKRSEFVLRQRKAEAEPDAIRKAGVVPGAVARKAGGREIEKSAGEQAQFARDRFSGKQAAGYLRIVESRSSS
jgi:hypothetical protein